VGCSAWLNSHCSVTLRCPPTPLGAQKSATEKNGRGRCGPVDARLCAARGLQLSQAVADENWTAQSDEVVVLSSIFGDDFRGEGRRARCALFGF
jgi:hypothetical protein